MLGLASTVSSGSPVESLYSITLDGTNDKIALGPSDSMILDGFSGITLSLWIKTSTAGGYLFSNLRQSDGSNFSLRFHANSALTGSPLRLEGLILNGSGTLIKPMTTADVADGAWHHIVLTGKASEQVLYIDGAVAAGDDATTTGAFGMDASSDVAHIGSFGTGSFFDGQIDEVSIWNSALNLASVQAIYSRGSQHDLTSGLSIGTGPLVAYYRMGNGTFDDKANGVVHDQHASGFGSEMVTNGHFDTNVSGWTQHLDNASSITQGTYGGRSGVARVVISTTEATDRFRQDITWEKGCLYYFSVDVYLLSGKFRIDGVDADIEGAGPGSGSDVLGPITYDAAVDDRWRTLTGYAQGQRTGGTDQVWIRSSGIAAEFYVDNFSIKKLNGFPGLTSNVDVPTAFSSDTP
tara:strand:+ start:293 stop:1513 length:1221 start_codon:yes stop_codon:yes gene_type:complete